MSRARLLSAWLLLIVLIACPPTARAAWPHDPDNGNVFVTTTASTQGSQAITDDGAGGVIVVWAQVTGANEVDLFAQRINANGVALWGPSGVAVCTVPGVQAAPRIVADGLGGAIIAWNDARSGVFDLYARRITAGGVGQWTSTGVPLCTATGAQVLLDLVSDGTGGAIAFWRDGRSAVEQVYAQRVTLAGTAAWTANGVVQSTSGLRQGPFSAIPDGAGGAFMAWADTSGQRVRVQRLNASGAPQWGADGFTPANDAALGTPTIVLNADGSGGFVVMWGSQVAAGVRVRAQRMSATGALIWSDAGVELAPATTNLSLSSAAPDGHGGAFAAWMVTGTTGPELFIQRAGADGGPRWGSPAPALCTAPGTQIVPALAADGQGGVLAVWEDLRVGGDFNLYGQRLDATGAVLWESEGAPICRAPSTPFQPNVISDGAGGLISAWQDHRDGVNSRVALQRVERFGELGDPAPVIALLRDVPGDQGGRLTVQWNASWLDVAANDPIDEYWIWRQVPAALAAGRPAAPARASAGAGARPRPGAIRTTTGTATVDYWEYVGAQVAHGFAGYSAVVPTLGDSTGTANPRTRVMVEAEQFATGHYWSSPADSGYSVDNLAPPTPAPFTGTYAAGVAALHWTPSPVADFASFRLHRGTTAAFVPGPANLVTEQPDTGYVEAAGVPWLYKLAAVDVHGNVSAYALVQPSGTVDAPPADLAFGLRVAGPGAITFTLPAPGRVRLAVVDVQGRRVHTLVDGDAPAGTRTVAWDGRGARGGAAPSGLYFVTLDAPAGHRAGRLRLAR